MNITVVGTGYVGLVTAVCLAEMGHRVTGVDVDASKIAQLQRSESPIYEPGLGELLRKNAAHERLAFTTELCTALAHCECVFIAVGTPLRHDGVPELEYVMAVARAIGAQMHNPLLVVLKSTVPVGTGDVVMRAIEDALAARQRVLDVRVASNPEFLKEGTAVADFMKPDRIIIGVADRASESLLRRLYAPFVVDDPGKLLVMDRCSAELTKYGANAMLATRISFMNELARLCEQVGADVDAVRLGMGSDPRIGRKFLYAGPGFGGSCFPKDLAALIGIGAAHGVDLSIVKAVQAANATQQRWVAKKIEQRLGDLKNKRIAVWGLAFKPGTDDVRESPAQAIIDHLLEQECCIVGHDPEASDRFLCALGNRPGFLVADTLYEAVAGADALVLVTEWSEYKRPNWDKVKRLMRQPRVFDFRNQYDGAALRALGFQYECVGRPAGKPAGKPAV